MPDDTVRLVEQARELARDGWYHSPGHVRAVLGCLADAVERDEARDAASYLTTESLRLDARVAELEAALRELVELKDRADGGEPWRPGYRRWRAARALLDGSTDGCAHDSVDTFASGAGRRVDVCMGCDRVLRHWTEEFSDA